MRAIVVAVSRAAFERAAREGGGLGPGRVWSTDSLRAPSYEGAVDVVCGVVLRPPRRIWKVAELWAPERRGRDWVGAVNTAEIRDITAVWSKLTVGEGGVVAAAKALKQARELDAADRRRLGLSRDAVPALELVRELRLKGGRPLARIRRRQLELVGERYDGRIPGAAALLDPDAPASLRSLTAHVFRGPDGRELDVFRHAGDSGCVFRAGTDELVAEIVQGHVQTEEAALAVPLSRALAELPKKGRSTRTKPGTKRKRPARKK